MTSAPAMTCVPEHREDSQMFHILRPNEQRKGAVAAVAFEGEPHRAGVSFFRGDLEPGNGPRLHKHPYPETCIIQSGQAAMTIDGQEKEVVAGRGTLSSSDLRRRIASLRSATNNWSRSAFTPPTGSSSNDSPNDGSTGGPTETLMSVGRR